MKDVGRDILRALLIGLGVVIGWPVLIAAGVLTWLDWSTDSAEGYVISILSLGLNAIWLGLLLTVFLAPLYKFLWTI